MALSDSDEKYLPFEVNQGKAKFSDVSCRLDLFLFSFNLRVLILFEGFRDAGKQYDGLCPCSN